MNSITRGFCTKAGARVIAGCFIAVLGLTACEQETSLEERAEEAGEQVEEGVATLKEKAEGVMNEMGEATEEATDEAEEAADEARK